MRLRSVNLSIWLCHINIFGCNAQVARSIALNNICLRLMLQEFLWDGAIRFCLGWELKCICDGGMLYRKLHKNSNLVYPCRSQLSKKKYPIMHISCINRDSNSLTLKNWVTLSWNCFTVWDCCWVQHIDRLWWKAICVDIAWYRLDTGLGTA